MEVRLADESEISTLTRQSKEAFDSDVEVGADEAGGPPDYDCEQWHREMQKSRNLYSIIANGELVGGMLLFEDSFDPRVVYVGRIFIGKEFLRKGYGREAMLYAERLFPNAVFFKLETPVWNIRTNTFYPSLGYTEMKRDEESVYYQKQLNK